MRRPPLWIQILVAIILALVIGRLTGPEAAVFGIPVTALFDTLGTLFLRALQMIVVPLIVSAVVTAIAGLGQEHALGRLGLKTIVYYAGTSFVAVLTGVVLANLIQPGTFNGEPGAARLLQDAASPGASEQALAKIGDRGASDFFGVIFRMVPENVIADASDNGALLGVIFFSILFGAAIGRLQGHPAVDQVRSLFDGLYQVMLRVTEWIMCLAPIGIFGLVASIAATTELHRLLDLGWFFLTVLLALLFHAAVTLPLLLLLLGRVHPLRHYKAVSPALLTAFSTASSSATLPIMLDCVQSNAGVSRRVSNFVLPLGATVNMDGTALYECVVVLFLFQLFGLELSLASQFLVVLLAVLTSVGVAGVPAASLVAIVVILRASGFPSEYVGAGLGLVLITDRLLDMLRTSVNVLSDSCGTVIIARSEGEETKLA